jgi:uncharacterized membrane protein YgaE (UPF0421/DUF939 family)
MLLKRHLREEDQIILIRNKVNDSITNDMMQSHANRDPFSNSKQDMFKKAKSKAAEAAMINYRANKDKFASQAPTEHEVAAQLQVDKFTSEVIAKMEGDLAGNLENIGYESQDDYGKN